MNYKMLFRGDYITAVEFDGREPVFTIKGVKLASLEGEDGKKKIKGIVALQETDRGWVLCRTNGICLAAMFGEETNAWIGKRVTLHAVEVQVGPTKQPGIRIKGSPDLERPLRVSVKLPRKRAFSMTMQPTGKNAANASLPEEPVEGEGGDEPAAQGAA